MTLSIKFVPIKQFDTQGTLMTPLPLRRVWMTNVLTGIIRKRYRYMQIGRWNFVVTGTLGTTRLLTRCIANLRHKNCTWYERAKMQLRNIFQKNNLDKPKRIFFSLKIIQVNFCFKINNAVSNISDSYLYI